MLERRLEPIEIGYHVFLADGGEEVGAVRQILPSPRDELVVYVENAGDFVVPMKAVTAVHYQKVVLDGEQLDVRLQRAIGHAHDAEDR